MKRLALVLCILAVAAVSVEAGGVARVRQFHSGCGQQQIQAIGYGYSQPFVQPVLGFNGGCAQQFSQPVYGVQQFNQPVYGFSGYSQPFIGINTGHAHYGFQGNRRPFIGIGGGHGHHHHGGQIRFRQPGLRIRF